MLFVVYLGRGIAPSVFLKLFLFGDLLIAESSSSQRPPEGKRRFTPVAACVLSVEIKSNANLMDKPHRADRVSTVSLLRRFVVPSVLTTSVLLSRRSLKSCSLRSAAEPAPDPTKPFAAVPLDPVPAAAPPAPRTFPVCRSGAGAGRKTGWVYDAQGRG